MWSCSQFHLIFLYSTYSYSVYVTILRWDCCYNAFLGQLRWDCGWRKVCETDSQQYICKIQITILLIYIEASQGGVDGSVNSQTSKQLCVVYWVGNYSSKNHILVRTQEEIFTGSYKISLCTIREEILFLLGRCRRRISGYCCHRSVTIYSHRNFATTCRCL